MNKEIDCRKYIPNYLLITHNSITNNSTHNSRYILFCIKLPTKLEKIT